MEIPKLAPYSSHSHLLNKCWPDTKLGCMVSQVKVRNLLLYHINEFVIWKLMRTNTEERKLEVGITIPKLTVSKKTIYILLWFYTCCNWMDWKVCESPKGLEGLASSNTPPLWRDLVKISSRKLWHTSSFSLERTDIKKCDFWKNSLGPFWRCRGQWGQTTSKPKMTKILNEHS